jgi:AraC family transcriptional regulator
MGRPTNGKQVGTVHFEPPRAERRQNSVCPGTSVAITAPRGGLAVWQRRLVAQYVEDHLAEPIPLATLAALARLSRYHFCRSFRRSFGISPHRYHSTRKIERAKMLLADPDSSVTAVALDVGFQETSAFTTAFRKLVGRTPSDYRRSLAQKET